MTEKTGASLKIRSTQLSDVDGIYALGKSAPKFAVSDTTTFWEKDELEGWVKEQGKDVLLVAELNGEFVGFLLAKYHSPTKLGTIVDVLVKEPFREQGIGTALLQEAKQQLLNKGASYLYALIQTDNQPSLNLFKSLGFTVGRDMTWVEFLPE